MVVMITPVAFTNIKWKTYKYITFACINTAMVPTIYFMYPETMGRTLEDIDMIFELSDPNTPLDVIKISRRLLSDTGVGSPASIVVEKPVENAESAQFPGAKTDGM